MKKKLIAFLCVFSILSVAFLLVSTKLLIKQTGSLRKADAIVVLGYPSLKSGELSPVQKSRVDLGIELYEKGLAEKILFTGGSAWNKYVEAEIMQQYAISIGIPKKDILVESSSEDTEENAKKSFLVLTSYGFKNPILVSSKFHTRRVNHIFGHYFCNRQIVAASYPDGFGMINYGLAILNEYFGFARHYICCHK